MSGRRPLLSGTLIAVLASLSPALQGCSEDSVQAPDGGGAAPGLDAALPSPDAGPVLPGACRVVPALLAQRTSCLVDTDCPCGSYCDLGLCTHDCEPEGDCGSGKRCDRFGRCSAPGREYERPERPQGDTLRLEPSSITLFDSDSRGVLLVSGGPKALGPVRVEAAEGLLLSCAADAPGTPECRFDSVPVGQPLRVGVLARDFARGAVRLVRVFTGSHLAAVSVVGPEPVPPTPFVKVSEVEGVYSGLAVLEAAGYEEDSAGLVPLDRPVTLPVTARIGLSGVRPGGGASHGKIVLEDPRRMLHPDGVWVGSLSLDERGQGFARFPRYVLLRDAALSGSAPTADVEILVAGTADDVLATAGRVPALTLHLVLGVTGMVPGTRHVARYKVSLHREGPPDPAVQLPAVPADAEPTLSIDRAFAPTPWEAVTASLVMDCPGEPLFCALAALCASPVARPPFAAEGLTPGARGYSGDLVCDTNPARSVALAADERHDVDTAPPSALGLVKDCRADLLRLREGPLPTTQAALLPQAPGCLDVGRWLYALGQLARAEGPLDERGWALAHRLLQRTVQVSSFLANEATQGEDYANLLGSSSSTVQGTRIREILPLSVGELGLLLHPRFALLVDGLPGAVLAVPDYRPRFFPVGFADPYAAYHDHATGLPVALLEALVANVRLGSAAYRRAWLARGGNAVGPADQALFERITRYTPVLFPVAKALTQRAVLAAAAGSETVAWLDRFRGAEADLLVSLGELSLLRDAVREGSNPLGVDDVDLPLSFDGEQKSTAAKRFMAVTEYLVNPTDGIAVQAVNEAEDAVNAAQAAWQAQQDRVLSAITADQLQHDDELELKTEYGSQINSLCGGLRDAQGQPIADDRVLDQPFAELPAGCYLSTAPGCQPDPVAWRAVVDLDDVSFGLCVAAQLKTSPCPVGHLDRSGCGEAYVLEDPGLDRIAQALHLDPSGCASPRLGPCAVGSAETCYECLVAVDGVPTRATGQVHPRSFAAVQPPAAPSAAWLAAKDACHKRYPLARDTLPSYDEIPGSLLGSAQCYRGSLGQDALTLQGLDLGVRVALSQLDEYQERYDLAVASCLINAEGNDRLERARDKHFDTMTAMRSAKLVFDEIAIVADTVKECAGVEAALLSAGVGCGAAVTSGVAQAVSTGIQFAMDQEEQKHEGTLAEIEEETAERVCLKDAEQNLVGRRTAALQVQQALMDLMAAQQQLSTGREHASALLASGRSAVRAIQGRNVRPLDHDVWLDKAIRDFQRKMRLAQRLVYLGVRAAEWEFQQSMAERAEVLHALTPEDLQTVLKHVRSDSGYTSGAINGSKPATMVAVLSLRDHLLQLADRSALPEGWQAMSRGELLRAWLQADASRYYEPGAPNRLAGRRIVFRVEPLGALGLGDAQAIPLLAGSQCAERLWSVNASIVGRDGANPVAGGSTVTGVELSQRNAFRSQWCVDLGHEGEPWQAASIRPAHNLFADPVVGQSTVRPGEASLYTKAVLNAPVNVPRAEFESTEYANFSNGALAARGVYGEYTLLLPEETLRHGEGEAGLDLNQVDDVLIRLEYVFVAK